MAAVSCAVGDCVGVEWRGGGVGLCKGAVPVGAGHASSLAKICVLLEAPQTGGRAPAPGEQQRERHFQLPLEEVQFYNSHPLHLHPPVLQGDFSAAMASLETCLSVLTRALPSCGLDLLCSLSWNLIRYFLHRPTPLGWLVHQVGGKHEGDESKTSARDAALVYHRLSQLQLTGLWKTPTRNRPGEL